MSGPPVDPVLKFVGGAVVAVGGLIAVLSGTCTLVVVGSWFYSVIRYPQNLDVMLTGMMGGSLLVAIVGGVPLVAGILLARWGLRMMRPRPRVRAEEIAVFSDDGPGDAR